ncbi:peptide ABC transporter permease [Anaerobacillus arseniciselenatis]|uniref:Peptide ABC transporter permease n=1 Tax=Anaerobacillus arseniciselenatis TaxID=85682 RepID=A0A1S2L884_9BACI|nr:ABC transporter permease [Anaerobacillus arseniciselenatis]OIJ08213.1 peptide ABC transporter permease [Anaerobacillus arseniciselenatis]
MNFLRIMTQKKSLIPKLNLRQRTLIAMIVSAIILLSVIFAGILLGDERIATNLENRNLAPSLDHPFGTDWLGRDMFTRTMKGLTLSIAVGLIAAAASSLIAVVLGILAATAGKIIDSIISWLVDLFLSVPHLVTLILIAFALGGGMKGVIIGLALTHWPSLCRVIRAEVMQLRSTEYVQISRKLGKKRWWIVTKHMIPHLIPQFFVGLILLFPHAILHEAAITFVGMGLSPHHPAIGIILSESMRYLSTGMWWLAFFPGLCLLIVVRSFDIIGENLRMLIDPHRAHE